MLKVLQKQVSFISSQRSPPIIGQRLLFEFASTIDGWSKKSLPAIQSKQLFLKELCLVSEHKIKWL